MKRVLVTVGLVTLLSCSSSQEKLLGKAIELDSLERFREAIAIYDKLLELDSSNVSFLIARAYDNERIGNHDAGIEDLKRAVKVGPNHALPLFELGIRYSDLGQYAESIDWFNKAIEPKVAVSIGSRTTSLMISGICWTSRQRTLC